MPQILHIIPARYASTRLPGKALAQIEGKTMIQRVYEQVSASQNSSRLIIATDHEKIYDHVQAFGGEAIMTSPQHQSGTDRCAEVIQKLSQKFDYVINIQGDEPFINPQQIDQLQNMLDGQVEIATQVKKIDQESSLWNPNEVKVVFNQKQQALYFSRSPIPYIRGVDQKDWLAQQSFYRHIGMYAYRADILEKIAQLPMSTLEKAESLEQLRWLENGFNIQVGLTQFYSFCIDTPEDLAKAQEMAKNYS